MADQWMIRGKEFGNCNCNWGCPCQFNSPSTYGKCEAVLSGEIEEGNFNDVRLDGLQFVLLLKWPGEIKDGGGTEQAIIEERASAQQREALTKILYGQSTAPMATHFFVYNAMSDTVLDPLYKPIEMSIDIEGRTANTKIAGIVESEGRPIIHPINDSEVRSRIHLPNGFEYTYAEMGSGTSKVTGAIELDFNGSYGQFNVLHMDLSGFPNAILGPFGVFRG